VYNKTQEQMHRICKLYAEYVNKYMNFRNLEHSQYNLTEIPSYYINPIGKSDNYINTINYYPI